MELSSQEREHIYLEEKAQREHNHSTRSIEMLLIFNFTAALILTCIYLLGRFSSKRKISIEDIRNAYAGLAPDEIEEEA